jgi:uncharacterized membrane protein
MRRFLDWIRFAKTPDLFPLTIAVAVVAIGILASLAVTSSDAAKAQERIANAHVKVAEIEEATRHAWVGDASGSWQSGPFAIQRTRPYDPRCTPQENAALLRVDLLAYLDEFPAKKD